MFLTRIRATPTRAKRTLTIDDIAKIIDGQVSTFSGAVVSELTALAQSTVYSCVKILAESIASLPLALYQRNGTRSQIVNDHPAMNVLRRPNEWQTAHEYLSWLITNSELRGNGYSFKVRTGDGRVGRLLPIPASAVFVEQMPDWKLRYTLSTDKDNIQGLFDSQRVMHLRNFGSDSFQGLSTIGVHREAIGLALQTERHGAVLFNNGAQVGLVFQHPGTLSDEAHKRLKESLKEEYSGARNAHKPLILEEAMKVEKVAMTAEDSQFLETRRFQKQEIAGIFGVPLFLLNDTEKNTTWGSGLEQISRAFVNFTLKPRLSRITQTFCRELLTEKEEREGYYFAFDTDEFTLGDMLSRFQAYEKGIGNGVLNPNECRAWENMNPRDGGDEYSESKPEPAPVVTQLTEEKGITVNVAPAAVSVNTAPTTIHQAPSDQTITLARNDNGDMIAKVKTNEQK